MFKSKALYPYVVEKPKVTLDRTKAIVVERNTEVNIKCTVKGVPTPTVEWIKDGKLLKNDPAVNITLFRDHSLR